MSVRDLISRGRGGSQETPVAYGSDPVNPFLALHREMNRLFDDAFRGFGSPALFGRTSGWPSIEVSETEKELRVSAELPGLGEKDVEVLMHDGILILRGEKHSEVEDKDRHFSERSYGRFERHLTIPVEVDEEKIGASFNNGVLTVTLPKSAKAQAVAKRIPINAGSRKQG